MKPTTSAYVTVQAGARSSQLSSKPKLVMPCKRLEAPVLRTFGNIVRNILFGPERVITAANTVVAAYQDSDDDRYNCALECTLYELKGATAAILGSTSSAITASHIRSVFGNDLAVLALMEALKQHGESPAVLDSVAYLAKSLAIESRNSQVPITALHVQLARALEDAARAAQCGRSQITASKDGAAAVYEACTAAAASAAKLAAAAPPALLMPHLDLVEQMVIAAGSSAGYCTAAGDSTAAYRRSELLVCAVELLAKICEAPTVPRPVRLDPDSFMASLSCWPLRVAKPMYLWQKLRSWKCLQMLAVALVDEEPGISGQAQMVLQDMIDLASHTAFMWQQDIPGLAAETIAALDRVCRIFCSSKEVGRVPPRGESPASDGSTCVNARAAEALHLLLSLLLCGCTTEVAELLTSELLQLEQQKVCSVQPEQLRVVQVLNKALAIILQAQDDAAASTAYSLIKHLVSAAEALRKQEAYTCKPTASGRHQWNFYRRSSDIYQLQVPKLLTKHFQQLKAVRRLMKQSNTQDNRPSYLADIAACCCCGVLPEACDDWEARVATAFILQPRHGMNSSAVFEREQSTTAGLFSSRRLRKLVKVKARGVVT